MKPCTHFRLEPLVSSQAEPPRSRLVYESEVLPSVVEGVVLEAQATLTDGRHLLLLTDNCPFEEQVHVVLLDAGLRVRDRYRYGKPYTPGLVEAVELQDAAMRFRFGGLQFTIEVRDKPDVFSPHARLYRYLQVTATPAAPKEPA